MDVQSRTSDPVDATVGAPLWAAAVLTAIWLGSVLVGGGGLDQAIVRATHVSERPWVLAVIFITRLGDWAVLVALPFFAAAALAIRGRRRLGLFVLGSAIVGRLLVELQKAVLGRARPDQFDGMVVVESYAFPSGHAANSMIVYVLLALLLVPDERRSLAVGAAIVLSLMIGISRVLLGVHWPTDVLGGWAFGLLWLLVCFRAVGNWAGVNAR